jgi:hypothetical protein
MKKTYTKPSLKGLGLLRIVTMFSCTTSQIGNTVYNGPNIEFTWR